MYFPHEDTWITYFLHDTLIVTYNYAGSETKPRLVLMCMYKPLRDDEGGNEWEISELMLSKSCL